jgi:hypothetical protein
MESGINETITEHYDFIPMSQARQGDEDEANLRGVGKRWRR